MATIGILVILLSFIVGSTSLFLAIRRPYIQDHIFIGICLSIWAGSIGLLLSGATS